MALDAVARQLQRGAASTEPRPGSLERAAAEARALGADAAVIKLSSEAG